MKNSYKINFLKGLVTLLFVILNFNSVKAQYIYGSPIATQGTTSYYSFDCDKEVYIWEASVGTKTYEYECEVFVRWDTAGTHYLYLDYYYNGNWYQESMAVEVIGTAPNNPTVSSSDCGQATLTRTGTPFGNYTWYWQGKTPNGTFTNKGSGETFIANEGSGTYYIRGRDSDGTWSSGSGSVYVTIVEVPKWYLDADKDGFGSATSLTQCNDPSTPSIKYVSNNYDCDDFQATVNPNTNWYLDSDNDGLGSGTPINQCIKPVGNYTTNNLDQCPTTLGTLANNGCPPSGYDFGNQNYIHSTTPTVETTDVDGLNDNEKTESIKYFDGIVRPMQSIDIRAGGNNEDIITYITYDDFGRQDQEYLPYAETSNRVLFRTGNIDLATKNFYNKAKYENTTNPYSQKEFEASPLNRVLRQAAPGTDWALGAGHEIRLDYQANTNADQVRRFGVSFIGGNTENPYLEDKGIYDPSQLYKTITKDENWQSNQTYPNDHTTQEFKDKEGRVILKRNFDAGKWLDTYYVYDDYGNLTYVLPPKVFTYHSITQPYLGQSSYSDSYVDGISFFIDDQYAELNISQQTQGNLSYYFYAYGFTPGSSLRSGKIADLNFTPNLPDITLGVIMVPDVNGNLVVGGTAYIQNGDLYFSSTGAGVYPENDEFYFNGNLNIADFQSSYTAAALDRTTLNDLIYQYRYDKRNRLIEKKLPGKEWEYIVYDKLDRPVLTQDANLKASKKWLFTKYDVFNRPVYTGEYTNTIKTTRADVQLLADAEITLSESKQSVNIINGTTVYYSNIAFPDTADINLFTINYYDDYDFDLSGGASTASYNITPITNVKGLATGNKVRVLGTTSWITSLSYYDAKNRPIYNYSKNDYLGTTSTVKSQFDFIGQTLGTTSTHLRNGITTTIVDVFAYDHARRLTDHTQAINGASTPEVIVANTYDELGQLISKKVGGKTSQGLQKVDYVYNIRGWLKSINDPNNLSPDNDLFGFGLYYNTVVNPSLASYYQNKPLYNGNISSTTWKSNSINPALKQYNYTYDALNRFKGANYIENNIFNYKFDESILEYDRNGNILALSRNMQNPGSSSWYTNIDQLAYTYDKGNKLMKVDDNISPYSDEGFKDVNKGSDDYSYDDNGNMTVDKNKAITNIIYNHLNLPSKILFNTGKSIEYVYDAAGVKQSKKVIDLITTTTDYAGGFQYVNNVLKFFPQPEGYVEYSSGNFNYIYQYKDHLGNIRLSYTDSNNDGIIAPPVANIYQTLWEDGFETDTGWSNIDPEISHPLLNFDTTVKHSGNRSARITMDSRSNSDGRSVQNNQWIAINNTEETLYRISGWIYIQNTSLFSRAKLSLEMKTADTNPQTQTESVYTDGQGQWIFVQKEILVPANFKYLNLRLSFETSNADFTARSAWYDDFKIEKVIPNSQNEIIAETSYYPFGLEHNIGNNVVTSTSAGYKYKYNGKELQDELGLNMYDYGMRNYDPALGRWMNIDPLAELSRRFSPYTYALNNPVYFIDPDGMKAEAGQSGNYYDWDEKKYKNKDSGETVDAETAIASHMDDNGEPPVTLFKVDNSKFYNVFKRKNDGNYQTGDSVFDVYGHGGINEFGNSFFADYKNQPIPKWIDNAEQFDERMSQVSPAYRKKMEMGKLAIFTLNLFICQSAGGNLSMAQRISEAHPLATVVGFDGWVMYGDDYRGKPEDRRYAKNITYYITGVSSDIHKNLADRYRVVYQGGKEVSRMLYSEYLILNPILK